MFGALNIIDLCALIYLAVAGLRGLFRGLTEELIALLRTVGALVASLFLYRLLGGVLFQFTRLSAQAAYIAAFFVVLIGAYILFFLMSMAVNKMLEPVVSGWTKRVGGVVLGMTKAAVGVALVLFLLNFWPHQSVRTAIREKSIAGAFVTEQGRALYDRLRARFDRLPAFPEDNPVEQTNDH